MKTKNYNLSISLGNGKMGPVPNWSLQAGATCPKGLPCYKEGVCYALHGNHLFPSVQDARITNTDFVKKCAKEKNFKPFIQEIGDFLISPDCIVNMFRVHESGDLMIGTLEESIMYADAWYTIMKNNPQVKFCMFTKAFDVLREVPFFQLPNCKVLLSTWTGMPMPEDLMQHYTIAWFKDKEGKETRIPDNGFICPGKNAKCIKCQYCFNKNKTHDVVLGQH